MFFNSSSMATLYYEYDIDAVQIEWDLGIWHYTQKILRIVLYNGY